MKYVCDGTAETTWFRIETQAEAGEESRLMDHAVAKYFKAARESAESSFTPHSSVSFEQYIGRDEHVQRTMPLFVTLRDMEGTALVTAMLPPRGEDAPAARIIIVGAGNADPYVEHAAAIEALGRHFGLRLERERCFPYGR